MKRAAIGIAVFFLILVVGVLVIYSSLGTIITRAVNTIGPKVFQTKVELQETVVDAATGKGSMRRLVLGNPKGFKTKHALKVEQIDITIEPDSIGSPTVLIKNIHIRAPEITYELGEQGSNIDALQRNAEAFVKIYSGPSKPSDPAPAKQTRTRLMIDHLYIKGGQVNLSATLMGGKAMTVSLPDIHLTDIGKKENGATPSEVAEAIIDALNKAVHQAVNPIAKVIEGAKNVVEGTAKGVTDTVSKILGK